MEKITKEEFNYLISKNILQQKHGNYGDSLVVTGKYGSGRGKQRFVTTPVHSKLLMFKLRDTINNYFTKCNLIYDSRYIVKVSDIRSYSFDYIVFEDKSKTNIKFLIEFYSGQYFETGKTEYCKNNNIKLLLVKYDQFNNVEDLFSECVL